MSEIDERVVEMRFDNAQFEKNVATSISTLDKLKAALKLDGSSKGLEELQRTTNNFNVNPLLTAVESVNEKFSALNIIGTTALVNITNKAINAGEALIKSLSVDNISTGWNKFEEKTRSVGTLVGQGFGLQEVNEQMERLNWFTDETSYNFTDMVSNISKFTATGKGLEESVTAMEGIALWAAASGQNATKASMAMYQLSQAMGKGVLKYDDWRSIQNASMDTMEFRQQAVKAAIALGKVKEVGEDAYEIIGMKKPQQFSLADMFTSDALSRQQWFTDDVMMSVFQRYDQASAKIKEYIDAQDELGRDITASQAIEELGDEIDELSKKWFLAGQEARTWGDVVDSVKDAVSTGWMNTFENIFGNYEEAKTLFSDMAETLYEIFAAGGNARNEVLALWKAFGGRDVLLKTLSLAFEHAAEALGKFKEGLYSLLPATKDVMADKLIELSLALLSVAENSGLTEIALESLYKIGRAIASIIAIVIDVVKILGKILSPLLVPINFLAGAFLELLGAVADGIDHFREFLETSETVKSVIDTVRAGVELFARILTYAIFKVREFAKQFTFMFKAHTAMGELSKWTEKASKNFGELGNKMKSLFKIGPGLTKILNSILVLFYVVGSAFANLFNADNAFNTFNRLSIVASNTMDRIGKIFQTLKTKIDPLFEALSTGISLFFYSIAYGLSQLQTVDIIGGLEVVLDSVLTAIENAINITSDFVGSISDIKSPIDLLAGAFTAIIGVFIGIGNAIAKVLGYSGGLEEVKKKFTSLFSAILAYASKIDVAKVAIIAFSASVAYSLWQFGKAIANVSKFFGEFSRIPEILENAFKNLGKKGMSEQVLDIAKAIGILALSLVALSLIDPKRLLLSAVILGALAGGIAAMSIALNKFGKDSGFIGNASGIIAIAGSMLLLAGALAVLEKIEFNHLLQSLFTLTVFGVGLVALSKVLEKGATASLKTAIVFLMFTFSIAKIVNAFVKLQNAIDPSKVQSTLEALIVMVGGIMAVSFAASKISMGSAMVLVVITGVLTLTMNMLQKLVEANVPATKIAAVFGTIVALIVLFGLIGKLITHALGMDSSIKIVKNTIPPVLGFAAALYLMVLAFDKLGQFGIGANGKTFGAVIGLIGIIGAIWLLLKLTKGLEGPSKNAALVALAMGAAVYAMAIAVQRLADIPIDMVNAAGALLAEIAVLLALLLQVSKNTENANPAAIMAIAAVIGVAAAAIAVLSIVDIPSALGAAISLGILMIALGKCFETMGNAVKEMKTGVAIALLGIIGFISVALMMLAKLPASQSLGAMLAVSVSLMALAACIEIIAKAANSAKGALKGAAAILIVALSLVPAAAALWLIAQYDFLKLLGAAVALGLVMAAIVVATNFAKDSVAGAASMLIMSASLVAMAYALQMIAGIDPGSLIKAGIALGAVIGVFALLTTFAMDPLVAAAMLVVAAALVVFAGALLGIAGAAFIFASAVTMIVNAVVLLSTITTEEAQRISENIPIIMNALATGLAEGMVTFVTTLVTKVAEILGGLIVTILAKGPEFISAGIALITNFITGILSCAGQVIQSAATIITSFVEFVMGMLGSFVQLGAGVIQAVVMGILSAINIVINAAGVIISGIISTFGLFLTTFIDIGKQIIEGIVSGLEAGAEYVIETAKRIGQGIIDGIKNVLGIHSPSEEGKDIGSFFDLGVGGGIEEMAPYVKGAAESMGLDALNGVGAFVNFENGQSMGASLGDGVIAGLEDKLAKLPDIAAAAGLDGGVLETGKNDFLSEYKHKSYIKKAARAAMTEQERLEKEMGWNQNKKEKEKKNPLEQLLEGTGGAGGGGGGGGGKGGGGGGSDKAEKEEKKKIDQFTKIMDYARDSVDLFRHSYASAKTELSDTQQFQASKNAVELLALQLYEQSIASETAEEAAERMGKTQAEVAADIKKAYLDMQKGVEETLKSQLNMYEKFESKSALKGGELASNIQTNADALKAWNNILDRFSKKMEGVEGGLQIYNDLVSKGMDAMPIIKGWLDMTDEEFEKSVKNINEMPENIHFASSNAMAGAANVAYSLADGFKEVLNTDEGTETGGIYGNAVLDGLRQSLLGGGNLQGEASPVKDVANKVAAAMKEGLDPKTGEAKETQTAASELGEKITDKFETTASGESGAQIGINLVKGIAEGIRTAASEAYGAAEEIGKGLVEVMKQTLGINSPSKAFMELGYYSDEGLAQGFSKYGTVVREAAAESALGAVDEMSGVFGRIADLIDGTIDLDPTIRPVLDLSNIQYGASQIGSLLGLNDPYAINAVGTISGIQNDAQLMAGLTNSLTDAINGMKGENELPPVTINIYPTENQSAEEIADAVSWKLNHDVLKRRAVYGGT